MSPRQLLFLKIGCWLAFLTGAMHLYGQIAGGGLQGANDDERAALLTLTTFRFELPGGTQRTILEFVEGFGLLWVLQLATLGGVGLVVAKRARADATLTSAVVRIFALVSLVMLGICVSHFFIIPSLFIALMTVSFAVASVSER